MMKRKFLAVVLPIIGCATVVGSGFSAWYFGEDVVKDDSGSFGIGINVTEEVKAAKGNLKINLDATTIDGDEKDDGVEEGDDVEKEKDGRLVLDQGGARNDSVDSGIMFGKDTSTVTTVTNDKVWAFTVSYDGTLGDTVAPGLTIDEIYDAGLRIRVEMTVTIDSTLNNYIDYQAELPEFTVNTTTPGDLGTNLIKATFDDKSAGVITANYIVDATKLGDSVTTKLDLNFSLDLNTEKKSVEDEDAPDGTRIDYSNKLFVYKKNSILEGVYSGGKPENGEQLLKMGSDVSSSSVVFSVIAHIEDDPTK